jgi:hypothetical protein
MDVETIILNIRSKSLANDLVKYIAKHGDEVNIIRLKESSSKKKEKKSKEGFFDIAGIWKDSDINLKQIREKAWRRI